MGNILFICGSLNQTTQMHAIARNLMDDHNCYFTPYYGDGVEDLFAKMGWLDFTVLGGRHRRETMEYLTSQDLQLDPRLIVLHRRIAVVVLVHKEELRAVRTGSGLHEAGYLLVEGRQRQGG